MFGSKTTSITPGRPFNQSNLKHNILDYVLESLVGLNCGLSLDLKNYNDSTDASHLYVRHKDLHTIFAFYCKANGIGFELRHFYAENNAEISSNAYTYTNGGGNYGKEDSCVNLTMCHNIYDTSNFIVTIALGNTSMFPYDNYVKQLSFGVLETTNGLCLFTFTKFCKDKDSVFINFAGLINKAVFTPAGKAFTAPAYYPIDGSNVTSDMFTRCIQANINGITQGGIYQIGGKEYICIYAPYCLLMEVKR